MNYYDTPVHNMFEIVRFIKCKVDCSGTKSKFRLYVMCYRDVYCTGLTFFLTGEETGINSFLPLKIWKKVK